MTFAAASSAALAVSVTSRTTAPFLAASASTPIGSAPVGGLTAFRILAASSAFSARRCASSSMLPSGGVG